MKTDHQLQLLAGATRNGKPVHPGLTMMCGGCWAMGYRSLIGAGITHYSGCWDCGGQRVPPFSTRTTEIPQDQIGSGYVPNPDPWAMIAACQAQGWEVRFIGVGSGLVSIFNATTGKWLKDGSGLENQAALTDAMFQATETLEPDNWRDRANFIAAFPDLKLGEHQDWDQAMDKMQNLTGEVDDDDGTRTGN